MSTKPRVVKDYEKLDEIIQEQIKLSYPYGFSDHLVSYVDKEGKKRTALPFETDEKYYLVRMTESEAVAIIDEDDDSSGPELIRKTKNTPIETIMKKDQDILVQVIKEPLGQKGARVSTSISLPGRSERLP